MTRSVCSAPKTAVTVPTRWSTPSACQPTRADRSARRRSVPPAGRIYGVWNSELLSTVWCTGDGDVRGIWAMGTPARHQRKGYGTRLLNETIRRETATGARSLFLMATPQGFPLYRAVGFETLDDLGIWVRGESPEFPT